jgi:hypothetical protein
MLRVLPWITDGATNFLDGYIADNLKKSTKVFEFGLGNSTLYFLSRGCHVTGVEHDEHWFNMIASASKVFEYEKIQLSLGMRPYTEAYSSNQYDVISIDGRDRVLCLKRVLQLGLLDSSIIVLDNTERISGFGGRYSEYTSLLKGLNVLHFEQPYIEGLDPAISSFPDRSGHRVNHRWITTIAFNASMNYTSLGKVL